MLSGSEEGSPEIAVSIRDLDITYTANLERTPTLRSIVMGGGRKARTRKIEALRGVSVDVERGTILGVIGHNGAGKTTLMRAVAGIIPPTKGRIELLGDVTAMLSMGIGFRTDLSGRDNIRLGGMATGLSPDQIRDGTDEIIDFAELREFIDLPMRTYSSGMRSRLAFSVATHANPDVLLIDEALAAGDARFKARSSERIQELCSGSSTVLLVSHGLATIEKMADKVLWLDKGVAKAVGLPSEIVEAYSDSVGVKSSAAESREDV